MRDALVGRTAAVGHLETFGFLTRISAKRSLVYLAADATSGQFQDASARNLVSRDDCVKNVICQEPLGLQSCTILSRSRLVLLRHV